MRDWEERMNAAGATVVNGEGVIAHEAPDAEAFRSVQKSWKSAYIKELKSKVQRNQNNKSGRSDTTCLFVLG